LERPLQIENLTEVIKKYIVADNLRFSKHAIERGRQRTITPYDAEYVLLNGYHEKAKTSYSDEFKTWKYAIRGKTEGNKDLRVIIAIIKGLIVITVIEITKKKRRKFNR